MLNLRFMNTVGAVMALALCCTAALGQEGRARLSYLVEAGFYKSLEIGEPIRIGVNSGFDQNILAALGEGRTLTGKLVSCGEGMLVFQPEDTDSYVIRVPEDQVDWLQVNQGRTSHKTEGALMGLLAGIAISVAAQTHRHQDEFLGDLKDGHENAIRGVGITIVSTMVGAAIGSAMGSDKWEKVYDNYSSTSPLKRPSGEYQVALGCSF